MNMEVHSIAVLFITISVGCMSGLLLMEMYKEHKKQSAHLDQYAQLRKHWEEKRIKEIEEAQADQIQSH